MSLTLPTEVLSQWSNMAEGLQQSSDQFYTEVERNLGAHQLKDVKIERVTLSEGGLFAAKREYLQIKRGEHVFHVCAAPYGNGFFVSSWLGEIESGFWAWMANIPVVGFIARRFIKPMTYYKADTAQMFHTVVHGAVTKALDAVLEAKSMRPLTESDRKPVMKDILSRM